MTSEGHWERWHQAYDDADSSLSRRLQRVQRRLAEVVDAAAPGPVRLISLCAGQGRDVIGALADHPRRADVVARLIELDAALVRDARDAAIRADLPGVQVIQADASTTSSFDGAVPSDVALVCGVFGNVSVADIHSTVVALPALLAEGGTVIWTRHRRAPDATLDVRRWFAETGFHEVAFDTDEDYLFGVGTHRLVGPARPYEPGVRMFRFLGDGADAST